MDGVIFLLIGVVMGIVMLAVVSCAAVGYDKTSHDKQQSKIQNYDKVSGALFAALVYCMSDSIDKETVINYITNAIKIGVNKDWIELKEDDVQIYDCAKLLYESVMKIFERGDV